VGLLEQIRVTHELAELSEDGSRMLVQNTFYKMDGKLSARVLSKIAWMDLNARKLVAPPEPILAALRNSPRSEDFREVPSFLRAGKS